RDLMGPLDGGLQGPLLPPVVRGPPALARRPRREAAREPLDDDRPARGAGVPFGRRRVPRAAGGAGRELDPPLARRGGGRAGGRAGARAARLARDGVGAPRPRRGRRRPRPVPRVGPLGPARARSRREPPPPP